MTPYEKVFKVFFHKIKDPFFVDFDEQFATEELIYLLNESISTFEYPKIDLRDKDDELQQFNNTLTFDEISILAEGMALFWAEGMLRDIDSLAYDMTPEEMRTTSKANHINSLIRFEDKLRDNLKARKQNYNKRDGNRPLFNTLGGDGE